MLSRSLTIVVVHANAAIRTPLMTVLGGYEGWSVYGATNGGETVRVALLVLPQIVLLDPYLRGMDGVATMAALRAHAIVCPIIALVERNDKAQSFWISQGFLGAVDLSEGLSLLGSKIETLFGQSSLEL